MRDLRSMVHQPGRLSKSRPRPAARHRKTGWRMTGALAASTPSPARTPRRYGHIRKKPPPMLAQGVGHDSGDSPAAAGEDWPAVASGELAAEAIGCTPSGLLAESLVLTTSSRLR